MSFYDLKFKLKLWKSFSAYLFIDCWNYFSRRLFIGCWNDFSQRLCRVIHSLCYHLQNKKKSQEWDHEQLQKLPKINVKVQDFFWACTCCVWIGVKNGVSILCGAIEETCVSFVASVPTCKAEKNRIWIMNKHRYQLKQSLSWIYERVFMLTCLLVAEIISVKGSVESYVPSVTICKTKKKIRNGIMNKYKSFPKLM